MSATKKSEGLRIDYASSCPVTSGGVVVIGDIVAVAGVVTTTTALCPEGRTVSLVTIEGSGHAWPGVARTGPLDASPSSTGTGTGSSPTGTVTPTVGPSLAPTADPAAYDTTGALWAFFKEHGR